MTATKQTELLPCPFCSCTDIGEVVVNASLASRHRRFKVYCKACQCRTSEHKTKKDARFYWNTRAQSALLAAAPAPAQQVECQECMLKQPEIDLLWSDRRKDADLIHQLRAELAALKAQQVGQELDELRRSCAEILGQDPETWPSHGNAPLAIASALALAVSTAPQPAPAQDVAGKVIAEHSGCGYGIQVDQLTVRLYRGDKVIMVRGPLGAAHDKQSGENK